ncbi:hypothetical protein DFJ77DRAFT_67407 [Powellomyces hirtus]|nr:hypothetical protein DFJ77DRAFT_67407 [Powellomyces hirtus]
MTFPESNMTINDDAFSARPRDEPHRKEGENKRIPYNTRREYPMFPSAILRSVRRLDVPVHIIPDAPTGTSFFAATAIPGKPAPSGLPKPAYRDYVCLTLNSKLHPDVISHPVFRLSPVDLTTQFARSFFASKAFWVESIILNAVGLNETTRDFQQGDVHLTWTVEERRATEVLLRWNLGLTWLSVNTDKLAAAEREVKFMLGSALFDPRHVWALTNALHNLYAKYLLRSAVEHLVTNDKICRLYMKLTETHQLFKTSLQA